MRTHSPDFLKGTILGLHLLTQTKTTEWNQARSNRGGGSGGLRESDRGKKSICGSQANSVGGNKLIFDASSGNSSFSTGATASESFWAFLAAAIALHMQQGCSPSNVSETASVSECVRRLLASIVAQATVCNAAQCRPVVWTSRTTTINLPGRANTNFKLAVY